MVAAAIGLAEAVLNITYDGEQGELPDPVLYDASDADIIRWATEAVRGGIPGITARADANLAGYVVQRFGSTADLPNRVVCRPKTEYGGR
jgi:hypothetical protein